MADREISYCTTSDGIKIAYSVDGEGPPLLLTPVTFESFVLETMSPAYREFSRRLAEGCQLIPYDCRNVGMSERDVEACTWYDLLKDVEAVAHAVGHERVSLCGRAMHSPTTMLFASRHPRATENLILFTPFTHAKQLMSREELVGLSQMARGNWQMAARTISDMSSRQEFGDRAVQNAEWYVKSTTGDPQRGES